MLEQVTRVLADHRYPLTLGADGLGGAGGAWLLERARAARATAIGERHFDAEVPQLVGALLSALRPDGYDTFVVEAGPESTRLVVEALDAGGVAAGSALLARHPSAVAFLDRHEELRLVADARGMGYAVWGVDQEYLGSPRLLLERLAQLTADPAARARLAGWLEDERRAFARFVEAGDPTGLFLLATSEGALDALGGADLDTGSEAARIARQFRASAAIYRAFLEQRLYDNNATRAALLKRNYLEYAARRGDAPSAPRALIKLGSNHAGRGRTPMYVHDLGNLVAELAFAAGGDSFHVMVEAVEAIGPDGAVARSHERLPSLAPAFDLVGDRPAAFDLAPLRPLLTQRGGKSAELDALQDVALRYDALVLFPRVHPSRPIEPVADGA